MKPTIIYRPTKSDAETILAHKRAIKAAQMKRYRARKKDGAVVSAERVATRGD